jgi:hypothetical protein
LLSVRSKRPPAPTLDMVRFRKIAIPMRRTAPSANPVRKFVLFEIIIRS